MTIKKKKHNNIENGEWRTPPGLFPGLQFAGNTMTSFFKLVYFANGVGKKAKAISSIRNIFPTPAREVSTSWFLHMTISVHREKYVAEWEGAETMGK